MKTITSYNLFWRKFPLSYWVVCNDSFCGNENIKFIDNIETLWLCEMSTSTLHLPSTSVSVCDARSADVDAAPDRSALFHHEMATSVSQKTRHHILLSALSSLSKSTVWIRLSLYELNRFTLNIIYCSNVNLHNLVYFSWQICFIKALL